jgi:uncharacterized protein
MLEILFGVIVGLTLGLTGGGGSIFALPLLVYGLGMPPQEAITLSLATVTLVALTGTVAASRSGLIEFRIGLIFAVTGLLIAPLGVMAANQLEDRVLLTVFSVLMVAVALSMWHKAGTRPENANVVRATVGVPGDADSGPPCRYVPASTKLKLSAPCSAMLSFAGAITGLLSGLFGVGGGFVIVPALSTITQLSIQRAVATSLFVITLIGATGFIAAVASERHFPAHTAGLFLAGGIFGMLLGQQFGNRVAGPLLQKIFAALMIVIAAVTLAVNI